MSVPVDAGNMFTTSITRAQYDALVEVDAPIPPVRWLIEPDGTAKHLYLSLGDVAVPTNPRADWQTRKAIKMLQELTEEEGLGGDGAADWRQELGELIESGEAFLAEHAEELERLVAARLAQLGAWRPVEAGEVVDGPLDLFKPDQVSQALHVVGFLRAQGW
jgi:hypothetical protein